MTLPWQPKFADEREGKKINVNGIASVVVTCHNPGRTNIIKLDKTPLAESQGGQAF